MSTVRLKTDWNGKKAGEVISVPFLLGRQLVEKKTAEYPVSAPRPSPAAPPAPTKPAPVKKEPIRPEETPKP